MFGNEEKAGLLKKYELQGYETDTDTVPQGLAVKTGMNILYIKDWTRYRTLQNR